MKKSFPIFPVMAFLVLFAACNKAPEPSDPTKEENTEKVVDYFRSPAFVGDISSFSTEMQEAIKAYFPMSGDKSDALVLFIGQSDVNAQDAALREAIDKHAFIVFPEGVDVSPLGIETSSTTLDAGSGYTPLFHCYSSYGQGYFYTEYQEPDATEAEEIESTWTEEAWQALVKESERHKDEVENDDTPDEAVELTDAEFSMDALVEWLLGSFWEQEETAVKADYQEEIVFNLEMIGRHEHKRLPFTLNKQIDKATLSDPDILNCRSAVDIDFRYFPTYLQSSNDDKAGDYYAVVSTVIPHNGEMWKPFKANHGLTQNRIIGYWFKEMDVTTSLFNADGSSVSGLNYYVLPLPENKNDSRKYTTGTSQSISGTLSGGVSEKGPSLGGSLSGGGTWKSSVSYELSTIEFERDTYDPDAVTYKYKSTGFMLKDGLGDEKKENEYYPLATRKEFTARTMWVWHIPSESVADKDTKTFKLKTKVDLRYGSWYHWRWTDTFPANERTHPVDLPALSWTLAAPNRVPWGIIALKNTTGNEMANVTFFDSDNKEAAKLTKSFSRSEVAKVGLPEGTYSARWDIINGDTNQTLSSWLYEGIVVKQGRDEASATTEISTINGVRQ